MGEWALSAGDDDHPGSPQMGLRGPWLWVAAPRDINALRAQAPAVARAWTEAMRAVSEDLVRRGYQVQAFVAGAYGWAPRAASTE